jgi:hypothetical protein
MTRILLVLAAMAIGSTAHAQLNIWAMNQDIQNQYNQAYAYQRPYYYAPPVYYQPRPYYGYGVRGSADWYYDFKTRQHLRNIEDELQAQRWDRIRNGW